MNNQTKHTSENSVVLYGISKVDMVLMDAHLTLCV